VVNRREFLGGAVLAAGVLAGGCAGEREPVIPGDAEVLAPLLAGEYAVLTAFGDDPAGVIPGQDRRDAAGVIAGQDRGHVGRLREAIVAAGGNPPGADGADPGTVLQRKQQNVFDYVAALPRLADADLRVLVMELLASEAEHLAALRLLAGQDPVPDAFAGFTPPVA
jgi:hypothetical protein